MSGALQFRPGAIWSLWDMQRIYIQGLVLLSKEIGRLDRYLDNEDQDNDRKPDHGEGDTTAIKHWQKIFKELEFELCVMQCERMLEQIEKYYTHKDFRISLNALYDRIFDEARMRHCLIMSRQEASFYSSKELPFGDEVNQKFSTSGAFEIDEAGKCHALGRSTAGVFHLMRVMEVALYAISKCLGIPDPVKGSDRNEGEILKKIKDELDARTNKTGGKSWPIKGDKELFNKLHASLDAVRAAWRNNTMHAESKYTAEEAEHIYIAVRAYMKALASRCDEEGQPAA
jgi:hypothetical protein